MNIRKIRNCASYDKALEVLENIYEYAGDCPENGYLGSSITNIFYDDFGRVEFQSENYSEKFTTKSTGAVLDDSVVIMQIQECKTNKFMQLYSWKCDGSSYTYFIFDSVAALEKAYNEIKRANKGFLAESLDDDLHELGISYQDIMNVRVAVRVERQGRLEKGVEEGTLEVQRLGTLFGS